MATQDIVQKLWNLCDVLRDDGINYSDYVTELVFAFVDRLEARLARAQTAATRLTPALLAKAFRGELVPQDPNDEPAAELLRRLAEKPATPAKRGRTARAI